MSLDSFVAIISAAIQQAEAPTHSLYGLLSVRCRTNKSHSEGQVDREEYHDFGRALRFDTFSTAPEWLKHTTAELGWAASRQRFSSAGASTGAVPLPVQTMPAATN